MDLLRRIFNWMYSIWTKTLWHKKSLLVMHWGGGIPSLFLFKKMQKLYQSPHWLVKETHPKTPEEGWVVEWWTSRGKRFKGANGVVKALPSFDFQILNPDESYREYSSVQKAVHSSMLYSTVGDGGWEADSIDSDQWASIDTGELRDVFGIAVQPQKKIDKRISAARFMFSDDGQVWSDGGLLQTTFHILPANGLMLDNEAVFKVFFPAPVTTRYIRLHPVACVNSISMRWGILTL